MMRHPHARNTTSADKHSIAFDIFAIKTWVASDKLMMVNTKRGFEQARDDETLRGTRKAHDGEHYTREAHDAQLYHENVRIVPPK